MTKEETIKYLKNNELDFQRATATLTICDLAYGSYAESDLVHGVVFSPIFIGFELKQAGSVHRQIVAKKIILEITEKFYADYLKDRELIERTLKKHTALEKAIDEIWKIYEEKRNNAEGKEIVKIYKDFIEVSTKWWHYAAILEDHGAVIHNKIVPEFAKRHNLDLTEAGEIFNILSHPEEQTILNKERGRFLDICLDVANGINPSKKIESYIKDFFWFRSNFYRATLVTEESLLIEVRHEIEKNSVAGISQEIKNNQKSFKRLHSEKTDLFKSLILMEEDKRDLYFAEKVIYWMDVRKIGMMKDFYYLMTIAEDVSKRTKINYDDLGVYTTHEFRELLGSGKKLEAEEVKRRRNGILIVWEKDKTARIFYGDDAAQILETATNFSHGEELKGQVASRGKEQIFRGRVKIVFQPAEDKFDDDDILVTSMTRIEFVPLMRKAKAIITDEGGIACHAAIVSRELGIPAIIGTKNATRVLKDGDLVEVNLENSTIKVIK